MEAAPDTTPAPSEREIMTWQHLGEAARHLAHAVVESGYTADIVLAIARGGLLPGGAVAYALGVKNSCAMNVEFYTDVDQRLEVPLILPPAPELIDLGDARMLIVDDVADTGRTLEVVHDFCAGKVAEVRTAVLYEKPHSVVKCDYVWRRTDRWIDFPWSAEPPIEGGGAAPS
jgi:hypoxanthine phosphoribosyltransferase